MAKLVISEPAIGDLHEIQNFIARDSPHMAEKFINEILDSINILEEYPRLGRRVLIFKNDEIRALIHKKYRILYQVNEEKDIVEILSIVHGSKITDLGY